MEENDQPGDFGDFFDSPGRSVDDSAILAVKSEQDRGSELKTNQSIKKQNENRNNSALKSVDRSSVSSDHDHDDSSHYSSDYVTDSDSESDTDSRSRRKKKERSRSRSASSRSGGSVSSESSDSSRRSRTRSSDSTDSSKSRTATPDSSTKKRKTGGKGKRRDSSTSVTSSRSVTSSSTYSGGKERGKRSQSPAPKQASRRQAWSTGETSASRRQDRPQTAKRRSSGDKHDRRDESRKQERNGKRYADSRDTDSDMTDVSPIASPRNGSVHGHGKELSDERFSAKSKPPVYQAMPMGVEDSGSSNLQEPDPNAIDLNILMKAVSELEKQKRVKSNTRRVMFEPLRARPMEKSNYTFNNGDTHRIEQENKRLLRQIMRRVQTAGGKEPQAKDLRVSQSTLTTSAINRRREQQRIENENLTFLKRLNKIKPSRGLARQDQLASYNSTVLHGIPIATLHPPDGASGGLRSGRQSTASSVAGSLGRTRSMTSIHSSATASSFGTASRQSSRAGSRPTSAKKSGRERPVWNDRW